MPPATRPLAGAIGNRASGRPRPRRAPLASARRVLYHRHRRPTGADALQRGRATKPRTSKKRRTKAAAPPAKKKPARRAPRTAPSRAPARAEATPSAPAPADFPIAALGASAGGLDAFRQLVRKLPRDLGMALVAVQHLEPTHESMLSEILARSTPLPVKKVTDGTVLEPGVLFVVPAACEVSIESRVLRVAPREAGAGPSMPVDHLFRSLAVDQGSRAIGVVLSGTGTDGTLGLKAIKEHGGITFAQDARSAKFDGMPAAATASGFADFVVAPEEIATELVRIARHPGMSSGAEGLVAHPDDLRRLFAMLRAATDVDFTHYKHTTIRRRILRRMVLHKVAHLAEYLAFLDEHPAELFALYQDLLIKVTSFFRDPETFRALKLVVFPAIVRARSGDEALRIWVPGCSTGEEVYSIAITLLEYLAENASTATFQIFATDVSEAAIEKARTGLFVESIALEVSPDQLRRYFTRVEGGYQIAKSIRDTCVFARQNVAKDPPFSRLDLVSCRNVLIYLEPVLQKRMMALFHYALKPTGFLMLGTAETIGPSSDLFALVDKAHKIYAKKLTGARPEVNVRLAPYGGGHRAAALPLATRTEIEPAPADLQREADRVVMARYAPPGVVINDDMEILQFRGHTGPYLEPAPGEASFNLLKMARQGLLHDLREAVHRARSTRATARKEALLREGGAVRRIDVEVEPLRNEGAPHDRCYLVLFEEVPAARAEPAGGKRGKRSGKRSGKREKDRAESHEVAALRKEVAATKEYLQSIIEEQEATNEELRSAHEEVLSSNEELQSINEELETAKEELQSTNEELTTVNEELQNRNAELGQLNLDLTNLLANIDIPIVITTVDLRIRRFTPQAVRMLSIVATDVGRPLREIRPKVDLFDLEELVSRVIDTVAPLEREVHDAGGRAYSMRIWPYRSVDDRVDGAVVAWIELEAGSHPPPNGRGALHAR